MEAKGAESGPVRTEETVADIARSLAAGDWGHAARLCVDRLSGSPEDIPLLAMLTSACENAGQVQRAREAAVQWVLAAPLDGYAHYRLAMIEQRLGNYRSAVERLQLAAELAGPDDDVALAVRSAMHSLDAIQLSQIMALREVDISFRLRMRFDLGAALGERGFALSQEARRELAAVAEDVTPTWTGRSQMPS